MSIDEKRRHERNEGKNPILWAYFNTAEYYPSKLINYGQEGLSFKSDMCLKPGTNLLLNHNSKITPAEVRWCRECSDDKELFEVGVRYHGLFDY